MWEIKRPRLTKGSTGSVDSEYLVSDRRRWARTGPTGQDRRGVCAATRWLWVGFAEKRCVGSAPTGRGRGRRARERIWRQPKFRHKHDPPKRLGDANSKGGIATMICILQRVSRPVARAGAARIWPHHSLCKPERVENTFKLSKRSSVRAKGRDCRFGLDFGPCRSQGNARTY